MSTLIISITSIITSAGTTKAKIVPFSTDIQQLQKMAVKEVKSTEMLLGYATSKKLSYHNFMCKHLT